VIPEVSRRRGRGWLLAGLAIAGLGGYWAVKSGLISRIAWSRPTVATAVLTIDQGPVLGLVIENGTLESSNSATVRCQVEALIGVVGGSSGGGSSGLTGRQGGVTGSNTMSGRGGSSGGSASAQAPAMAKAKSRAGVATKGGAATKTAGASAGAASAPSSGGGASGVAAAPGGSSGATGSGGGGTGTSRPVIRSFTYQVTPYTPLRPAGSGPAPTPKQPAYTPSSRSRSSTVEERPGSTRIISILPEGTHVRAGQIVCEFDSAAFRDELQAQRIRHAQAKAWVEQAQAILEVNEITLKEYRDGIYPQDAQLIRQYMAARKVEADREAKNLAWSRETAAKGFRSPAQVKADELGYQQAQIALAEAQGMALRLEKFTAPRLIKNLQAKIEAIRADKLAQESVFQLEDERLKRLEKTVENCTLRAPAEGIVVYANQANRWGRTEAQIDEGVTVREGQAIFYLPDPRKMRVRARINESKVSAIHKGMPAAIRIDAFPGRVLRGTVDEDNPIPAPANGPTSDVRIYYATVTIDSGGFDELRPGLSAELTFEVEPPHPVTRVPVQAVRWVDGRPFAAVSQGAPTAGGRTSTPRWQWRRLTLGQSDPRYAEVVAGLKPGDRVLASPERLPAPRALPREAEAVAHAGEPGAR
jgi:multidrug resistance efflux pump